MTLALFEEDSIAGSDALHWIVVQVGIAVLSSVDPKVELNPVLSI